MSEEEKTGWEATSASSGQPRRYYKAESMYSSREELAKIVELDPEEFDKWCRIVTYKVDKRYPSIKTIDMVSVPNVLIRADIMRGGGLYDRVLNLGGTIGILFDDFTRYGYNVVNVDEPDALVEAINKNIGNIWGIIIYAHGNPLGYINASGSILYTTQKELIGKLHQNGCKIAKAYLNQCYSGYKGKWTKKGANKKQLEKDFTELFDVRNLKNYTIVQENNEWKITFTIDWRMEWHIVANKVEAYNGENVLGIDSGKIFGD